MRISINISDNPTTLLRRAGYTFIRHSGDEMSFVRVLGSDGYPRFHAYVRVNGSSLDINLHLDQKRHTYGNASRHHGEYGDDGALKEEADRLMKILSS